MIEVNNTRLNQYLAYLVLGANVSVDGWMDVHLNPVLILRPDTLMKISSTFFAFKRN